MVDLQILLSTPVRIEIYIQWYYSDVEYNVILDEKIEGTQYKHGKYGVYNWVRITNGWVEADINTIALAEAHMA